MLNVGISILFLASLTKKYTHSHMFSLQFFSTAMIFEHEIFTTLIKVCTLLITNPIMLINMSYIINYNLYIDHHIVVV